MEEFHSRDTALSFKRYCTFIQEILHFHSRDTALSFKRYCTFIQEILHFHSRKNPPKAHQNLILAWRQQVFN